MNGKTTDENKSKLQQLRKHVYVQCGQHVLE